MPYDDVSDHLMMLRDTRRTEGYRRAIEQQVKHGDNVIDFGCGSGILSLFCARAGAARVYAIDRSPFIRAAEQIAVANGYSQIEFIQVSGEQLKLDKPVDVIVSEWMGHFLFWEWMLEPLIRIRDLYLAPGGVMLPAKVRMHCALVTDPTEYERLSFFRRPVYDLDYTFLADWPLHQPKLTRFDAQQVSQDSALLAEVNLSTIKKTPERVSGQFIAHEDIVAYGLCGWFDADLTADLTLDTSPHNDPTHWKHVYFPLESPLTVAKGQKVEISIWMQHPDMSPEVVWRWQIRYLDIVQDLNNFAHKTWLHIAGKSKTTP